MSVNIWNPNEPQDSEHRTKEAMTRIMANVCKQSKISIPTLDDDFGDLGLSCLFHTVYNSPSQLKYCIFART